MNKKNTVTWNTMILGLASHGYANEALALFSNMLEQKLWAPDDITFLVVLSACSHGGMVDKGWRFFDIMKKEYHIQPTIKHYGCMVDILGRAGFVEEAYRLISNMPMQCNAIVWRTLLAACRLHGNVELGKQVRKQLLELEPDHSSDYVLLANTYASAGRWNEAMRVRKTMHKRGVQKPEPGNSVVGRHPSLRSDEPLLSFL
jgi:pentatricopeptide repeat protein